MHHLIFVTVFNICFLGQNRWLYGNYTASFFSHPPSLNLSRMLNCSKKTCFSSSVYTCRSSKSNLPTVGIKCRLISCVFKVIDWYPEPWYCIGKLSDGRRIYSSITSMILLYFQECSVMTRQSVMCALSLSQVKENLLSCKMLLHCKRDELRKLWIEGIEHKHVLELLDEIENIKQVPQKLETCMASKHYLHATDMLVSVSVCL